MSISSTGISCGEMRVVSRSDRRVSFEWIPIFHSLSDDRGECCSSPEIRAMASTWFFILYPNGLQASPRDWIVLHFFRRGSRRVARYKIGVKLPGETEREMESNEEFEKFGHFCFIRLLPRSDVLKGGSNINLTGQLTITCRLWTGEWPSLEGRKFLSSTSTADSLEVRSAKGEKRSHLSAEGSTPPQAHEKIIKKELVSRETKTEEQSDATDREENDANLDAIVDSTLQRHLKDLLLAGDDHDVVIKVGNQMFRAHKCMLRARSPVFAAMFRHELKESEDGSITIDDCDPDAFGEFLNYVYTGKVEDLSPSKASGLYYASDKYDFPGLKKVCVQFLESSLSTTSICDVVELATRHDEKDLLESAIKFFSENTKQILITVEWQRFAVNNFVAANELFLRAVDAFERKK